MLAVSNVHCIQLRPELALCSSLQEIHAQRYLPNFMSANCIPRNSTQINNVQELIHPQDKCYPCCVPHPCQSKDLRGNGFINCCGTNNAKFPVIQHQHSFVNVERLKSVSYTSHSDMSQDRNISCNHLSFPSKQNHLLHNSLAYLNTGDISISSKKDNTFVREQYLNFGKTTERKDVSECHVNVKTSDISQTQEEPSYNLYNTSAKDDVEVPVLEEGMNRNRENNKCFELVTRCNSSQYLAQDHKKLRHSIESILNISQLKDSSVIRDNSYQINENDNVNRFDNISDDDSSNISDIFVDDDIVLLSDNETENDDRERYSRGVCINHQQDLFNSQSISFTNEDNCIQVGKTCEEIEKQSEDIVFYTTSSLENKLDKTKKDFLNAQSCFKTNEENDNIRNNNISTSSLDKFQICSDDENLKIPKTAKAKQKVRNVNIRKKDTQCVSQIDSDVMSSLTTQNLLSNTTSTVKPSLVRTSSTVSNHVLPPIQTLCQSYKQVETGKRSAFKPIGRFSDRSPQVPNFLTSYRGWSGSDMLSSNVDTSKHKKSVDQPAIPSCYQEMFPFGQSRTNPTGNKSKLVAFQGLKQNSTSFQSHGVPQIFLPSDLSVRSELLPNGLESWMTWLRHQEPNSVKPVDYQPRMSSRVPHPPRYYCDACTKTYSTFGGISKHRQFHCAQHVKKDFACKVCNRAYSSLGALKMHIRTHTLPCRCQECGKAFSRPWLLQGHLRTHTGEKPFKCNHCGRAFADRSNLRAHLQTHADIKRYACTKCEKTFSRMSLLIKHTDGSCPVIIRKK